MKKWKVHLVLQAKGGIGKSYVSSLLAQLLQRIFDNPKFIDLDQENPTFSQYGALGASRLSVMDDNHSIDPMMFDKLMEMNHHETRRANRHCQVKKHQSWETFKIRVD